MDEMKLLIEGIENKLNRLLIKQNALTEKIKQLDAQKSEKDRLIEEQRSRLEELEKKVEVMSVAKALSSEDNAIAKHKVDEILRDIDKSLKMLNK